VVDVTVLGRKRDYYEADVLRTISFDATWAQGDVKCPHYKNPLIEELHATKSYGCGGCKRQVMGYDKQLLIKKHLAEDSFRDLAHIHILDAAPSPKIRGYRNKIEYSFGKYISLRDGMEERRQVGFHKQGEFAKVLDIDTCYLTSDKMQQVFTAIKTLCQDSGLTTYDHKTQVGVFRHMVIREGVRTDQLMVNLSISDANLITDEQKRFRESLKQSFKDHAVLQSLVTTFLVVITMAWQT
jgi:23S rRNA (uracil1939-C5)-methyltransferase